MTTMDSLRRVLQYAIEFLDIIPHSAKGDSDIAAIAQLIAAYDALAPDWNEAPNWAKWYAIDCHNAGFWFDAPEPLITYDNETYDAPTWTNNSICKFSAHVGLLPFGIDWRLCKWQRPEVAP